MLIDAKDMRFSIPHWCGLAELPYAGSDQRSELQPGYSSVGRASA